MARESKAEEIFNYIREQILLGRWEQGARLNDLKIAEEIQINRLSVREALFRLIETGVIEKTHWKGYFIKHIDLATISSIIELRVVLEIKAIENLITDGTKKDFAQMEQAINKSEKLINKNDLSNFLIHDYHFHELIHSCQHNSYITSTLKKYLIAIHFIRYMTIGKDKNYIEAAKLSIKDHRLILEAIRSRDIKLSTNHFVAHLSRHEQYVKMNSPSLKSVNLE